MVVDHRQSSVFHPYVNEWETNKSSSLLGFYGYFDIYNCIDTVGGYSGLTSMAVLLYLLGTFFLFYHRTIVSIKTK